MFADLMQQLAHAPPGVVAVVAGLGLFGFYNGFRSLRRYRLIEDVPTARVRSAPQGYVELNGTALMMSGEPIIAPLTGTQCCWFHYRVEERADKNWRTVEQGSSDGLFVLRDATGDCVIDPEGAEVDSLHSHTWLGPRPNGAYLNVDWRALSTAAGRSFKLSGMLGNRSFGSGNYRCTERVILDGDRLYAIGWFRSHDDSDLAQAEHELVRDRLREWKQSPETLLARFDHNRDGQIDAAEWDDARRVARNRVRDELSQNATNTHLHTLSKPKGRAFLLSNREEQALVRRHKWISLLGFGGFFICGVLVLLMLLTPVA